MSHRLGRARATIAAGIAPAIALSIALSGSCADAQAQDYPTKPITLIVPFAAGGGSDLVSRLVMKHLGERLGQSIVIDNRGGAGGNLGMAAGSRAAPDGYTLTVITQNITVNPHMYRQMPFDPLGAFQLITTMVKYASMLVAYPGLPATTVAELVAYGRERGLTGGHGGVGGQGHLGMLMLARLGGVKIEMVSYRGEGPVLVDLIAGRTELTVQSIGGLGNHLETGTLRGLAVTALERSPLLPAVPAVAETLPGYDLTGWYGIGAPPGTPLPIVGRLRDEISAVLALPEVRKELLQRGFEPVGDTPAEFARQLHGDYRKMQLLIEDSGIKPN
jgi:tripartite-type tricarboxylate transporter receptor subunit TctC